MQVVPIEPSVVRSILPPPLLRNALRNDRRILMLPDVQGFPSHGAEFTIFSRVSFAVRGDLVCPPCCVGLGRDGVLRTAMPETTVDEDGQPQLDDDDVGTTRKIATVQPETDPPPVEFSSQHHLGTSVRARQALHEPADRFAGCGRCTTELPGHGQIVPVGGGDQRILVH